MTDYPELLAALTEIFDRRADPEKVPAASVAVLVDRELHQFAFGTKSHSRFQACSISKPIAATVALRLVAEGRIDLDEDVNTYLTSWRMPSPLGWDTRITVRHLLSHSGALTTHGFPGYAEGEPRPSLVQILDGEGPANTHPVRVDGVPGLTFRYSGGGYQVLQLLLEDLTGRPFAELAHEYVLDPIGMDTAGYEPIDAAVAHLDGVPVEGDWHTYPEQAAAGLWCTPTDLVRFFTALRDAAEGAQGAILPRELAAEMLTEVVPRMGLGVQIERDSLGDRFGHGGDNHGYKCLATASRTGGLALSVMSNSEEGFAVCRELELAAAKVLGWDRSANDGNVTFAAWRERYAGTYRTESGVELRIGDDSGQLSLFVPGQPPLAIDPTGDTAAFAPYAHATIGFEQKQDQVTGLTLRQFGTEITAVRQSVDD